MHLAPFISARDHKNALFGNLRRLGVKTVAILKKIRFGRLYYAVQTAHSTTVKSVVLTDKKISEREGE